MKVYASVTFPWVIKKLEEEVIMNLEPEKLNSVPMHIIISFTGGWLVHMQKVKDHYRVNNQKFTHPDKD